MRRAAAVVDRDPGRAACGIEERVEERPVGHRIRAVAHRLGLAVGARDGAGIEVVSSDDDRRLELPARDHLIEGEPEPLPVAEAHPADACRQALELDALARHVEPVMQMPVPGQELAHFAVGAVDVLRVARERRPAERTHAAAEERADVGRDEAGERKGVLQALVESDLAEIVAVVEHRNPLPVEGEHGLDVPPHGGARLARHPRGVLGAQAFPLLDRPPLGQVAV